MNCYLPEGMQLRPAAYTTEDLWRAIHQRTILQAMAVLCDEAHNLHVDLGCCHGVIPREEAALGITSGETRDIAILSRVGKPVCFHVSRFQPDGSALLSRREAQLEALDALFSRQRPGDIVPAVVTSLAPVGAFCDVGCGVSALLPLGDICVSHLQGPGDVLSENQSIFAAIRTLDPLTRRVTLTLKELLGTWQENAGRFARGQTVTGVVRSVKPYGAFIALAPNLAGLSEPTGDLRPGDAVSVYIKSIIPEKLKIKLCVIRKLGPAVPGAQPLQYTKNCGSLTSWRYGTQELAKVMTVF